MEIRYVDIHSHLNLVQFADDKDQIAQEMRDLGVATITVGTNAETSAIAVELAKKYEHLYACVGLHPVDDPGSYIDTVTLDTQLSAHDRVVAVGETGLDYFRLPKENDSARQRENFLKQIERAIQFDKPLMLHIRPSERTVDAYDDVLAILRELKPQHGDKLRGNAHFFAGTAEQALAFNALGFTVSFTGVITFASEYESVVRAVPLDMMHAETDAPYVAPVPYRGHRCLPHHVIEVYKKIAEIKNEDPEIVRKQLLKNAERVFGIAF